MKKKLRDLKRGDFFTRKDIPEPNEDQVWVKGGYDRYSNMYICHLFSDVNEERFVSGEKEVFTDFTF